MKDVFTWAAWIIGAIAAIGWVLAARPGSRSQEVGAVVLIVVSLVGALAVGL